MAENKSNGKNKAPIPRGKLIAIGGKENKGEQPERGSAQEDNKNFLEYAILERFVKELKGQNPRIAIIPTASTVPEEISKDYIEVFQSLGVNNLEVVDIRNREDAMKKEYLDIISEVDGVMFTGGDQLRLTSIYGGTAILDKLKERYIYEDFVIAGTSAGAAALSTPMIYEGQSGGAYLKGDVRVTLGLEFIKDVAIDTHFIARGRIVRMTQCLAGNPSCIGMGLEEDTAMLITDGRHGEVLGSGLVTIVDPRGATETNLYTAVTGEPVTIRNLTVHLLGKGDTYTFHKTENVAR
jgi:cyanophycinase